MAQDIANEFRLDAEFHLPAGLSMAQHMSTEVGSSHAGTLCMGVEDVPDCDRAS